MEHLQAIGTAIRNGAEGVGFEPTDSLLSSAFKALALGRYANPPERHGPQPAARRPFWQSRGNRCAGANRPGTTAQETVSPVEYT